MLFFRKKKKGIEKEARKTIFQDLKERAIAELAKFLINRFHFDLSEALKASEDFWKKWEKKLAEVIG
ncbi:MAG: hypothetical protein DRJ69_07205 [Thermoprotei archaeon]|nr:MAG: hypothetical protein DRJ69_07205 [Thermoprotei archaeon]